MLMLRALTSTGHRLTLAASSQLASPLRSNRKLREHPTLPELPFPVETGIHGWSLFDFQ